MASNDAEIMREEFSPSKKVFSPKAKTIRKLSQMERTELKKALRVVRAVVQNGRKLVGVRFPPFLVKSLERVLYVSEWKRRREMERVLLDVSSCPEFGPFILQGLNFTARDEETIVIGSSGGIIEKGCLIEEFRWRVENHPRYDEYVHKLRSNQRGGGRVGSFIGMSLDGLQNEIERARRCYFAIRRRVDAISSGIGFSNEAAVKMLFEIQFRKPMKMDKNDEYFDEINNDEKVDLKSKRKMLIASQRKLTSFFSKSTSEKRVMTIMSKTKNKKYVNNVPWSCPRCTLDNNPSKRSCDACGCIKPLTNDSSNTDDSPSFSKRNGKKKKKTSMKKRKRETSSMSMFLSSSSTKEKEFAGMQGVEKSTSVFDSESKKSNGSFLTAKKKKKKTEENEILEILD